MNVGLREGMHAKSLTVKKSRGDASGSKSHDFRVNGIYVCAMRNLVGNRRERV